VSDLCDRSDYKVLWEQAKAERDALRAEVGRLEAEGLAIADGQIADRERLEAEVASCQGPQWYKAWKDSEAERDALRSTVHDLSVQLEESGKEERALREIMRRLVAGIDKWNASVTPIIGRAVDYKWPALEEARAAAPEGKPKHASYCGDSRGPDPLCGGCGMPWPALEVK